MPFAALRYCSAQGCPQLVAYGRCENHARKAWEGRTSPLARGYDHEYKRNRSVVLARDSQCTLCHRFASTEADHIIPVSRGGDNSIDNLRGTCKACNAKRNVRAPRTRRAA